jgi:hypothetical protein
MQACFPWEDPGPTNRPGARVPNLQTPFGKCHKFLPMRQRSRASLFRRTRCRDVAHALVLHAEPDA